MKRRDRVASRRTSTKTGRPRQRGHSKRPISHADDLDPFIHQTCAKHASSTRQTSQPKASNQVHMHRPAFYITLPCRRVTPSTNEKEKYMRSDPQRRPPILPHVLCKQPVKLFCRLPNGAKRILKGMSKIVQFLRNAFHRKCIGKEEQLSRAVHLAVLDHI